MIKNIIAFGDIHGCYEAAQSAVLLAEELNAQAVFLGDYVDRGPSAVKTLSILIAAQKKHPDWVFLRGNHDQMLLDLIKGIVKKEDIGEVLGMNYGYNHTVKSLVEYQQISVVEQNAVFTFLNSLKPYYETENYIFCHGIVRNTEESIENKSTVELMWNYNYDPKWDGKPFIHGHLPVKKVTKRYKGININTECGYYGCLSGLLINVNENDLHLYSIKEDGTIINK
jgi:serine/threonine protein phosphatase 1